MNQKRKPKEIIFNIDFGRNVKGEFVELPNGGLAFKEDGKPLIPVSARFTMSQDRENKDPKVIIDIPIDPENISFYLSECLLTYDIVYAIDTNSIKTKNGLFVSVGCAMEIDDFYQKFKNRETKLTIICRETTFAHREIQLGEKLSLVGLISLILKKKINKNPDLKVGIVTDHDLGNIDKYNSRKIPILNSLYLPENIELIYASADKKNASFLNQLMSMCDKRATETLNRLNLPK